MFGGHEEGAIKKGRLGESKKEAVKKTDRGFLQHNIFVLIVCPVFFFCFIRSK